MTDHEDVDPPGPDASGPRDRSATTDADGSGPVAPAVEAAAPDAEPSAPAATPSARRLPPEYEFSDKQNELVGALAAKMSFVGTTMIVFGILLDVLALVSVVVLHLAPTSGAAVTNAIAGAALLCVGFWTRGAARHFQNIVDTAGSDVSNLMVALEELFRIYALQRVLFLFTSTLAVLAIVYYVVATP